MKTPSILLALWLTAATAAPAQTAPPPGSGPAASAAAPVPAEEGEFRDPFAAEDEAAAQAKPGPAVSDPLEKFNRGVYRLNDKLYSWLLRPAAKGYRFVAPKPVRESVDRLFENAKYPVRGVNNLLQGRIKGAGIETWRFVINTTVGVGGLFDPASRFDLKKQEADFDRTLALYGHPAGAYLVLPLLGPSTVRGAAGTAGDMALSPTLYLDLPWGVTAGISGGRVVNTASLRLEEIDSLRAATLDPYAALRSAYFQSREQAR